MVTSSCRHKEQFPVILHHSTNSRQLLARQQIKYTMRADNSPQNDHRRIAFRDHADVIRLARRSVPPHHRERSLDLRGGHRRNEPSLIRHI